jgi:hypothetical protein
VVRQVQAGRRWTWWCGSQRWNLNVPFHKEFPQIFVRKTFPERPMRARALLSLPQSPGLARPWPGHGTDERPRPAARAPGRPGALGVRAAQNTESLTSEPTDMDCAPRACRRSTGCLSVPDGWAMSLLRRHPGCSICRFYGCSPVSGDESTYIALASSRSQYRIPQPPLEG